jgi:hypothetical protein
VIIRRNELKPPSIVGVSQNGESQPRKSAIKNSEKSVAFKKEEPKERNGEKMLMISSEKVKRHKQR